jgi:hypothetical protein
MLRLLAGNAKVLSIIGASIAFAWSIIRFVLDRRKELQDKEFEAYHRLIKEFVSLDPESKVMWIDRQAAVVFELRHFPRYFEFTARMLVHLRENGDQILIFNGHILSTKLIARSSTLRVRKMVRDPSTSSG